MAINFGEPLCFMRKRETFKYSCVIFVAATGSPSDRTIDCFFPKPKNQNQNNDSIPESRIEPNRRQSGPKQLFRSHRRDNGSFRPDSGPGQNKNKKKQNVAHPDSQQVLHDPRIWRRGCPSPICIRIRGVVLVSDLFSLCQMLKLLAPRCKIVSVLVVMTSPCIS